MTVDKIHADDALSKRQKYRLDSIFEGFKFDCENVGDKYIDAILANHSNKNGIVSIEKSELIVLFKAFGVAYVDCLIKRGKISKTQ